jgi:hypothetical protein
VTGRINGDFAGIHSAAYRDWAAASVGPGDRPKSVLRKHAYYYGWGLSSRLGAALTIDPFEARAAATMGSYRSQQGLDRAQREITHDPASADRMLELETGVGLTLPHTPLRLGMGWAVSDRVSRVEGFQLERRLRTWSASLELVR